MKETITVSNGKLLPNLLNSAGLAEHLGVSERYVRRLVSERRIPFVKWGHYVRFDPVEVTKWLQNATVGIKTDARRYW